MILFRICLASPGESDINGERNKNINVPQQINNVGMPDTEVIHNPVSELVSIDPDNYTDINLDRMHDFDDFDDALADNSQFIEIPFGGIVRRSVPFIGPNPDNSLTNPHLLTLKSDNSALQSAIELYLFFNSSGSLAEQIRKRKIVPTRMWKDVDTGSIWAAMIIDTYKLVYVFINPHTKAVKVALSRHYICGYTL